MSSCSKPRSSSSRARRVVVAWALSAAFAAAPAFAADAAEAQKAVEDYAVIVSADVPLTAISFEHLRRIFLFTERYWKPGAPVRVLLSDDGLEPGSIVLEKLYRMDAQQLRRYILEKLYQQEIDLAPKVVASDELAAAFVVSGSRLIAVVKAEVAKAKHARVLPVDGVLPGAPGYDLRK